MASQPGVFTEWPWQRLGNFKYMLLAPSVVHTIYTVVCKDAKEMDLGYVLLLPAILSRLLHNQIWISISRFQQARSEHRIVERGLEFDQVDRESNWDDHILLAGIVFYLGYWFLPNTKNVPLWTTEGAIIIALCHIGPVEFFYYWWHRALHHHFLYSRYHSHHHASIVTEPITSVIHPFAELVSYYLLFAIPAVATIGTGTVSILTYAFYLTFLDFMNNMGHCNFELVPKWLFRVFPPLKYLMYTPSFHSLHHTKFRTNYCLFMPLYDYIYNTADESSDDLYNRCIQGKEELTDVVHITHLTTLQSTHHIRLGLASLASKPYKSKWYNLLLLPIASLSMILTWIYSFTFTVGRNNLKKLKMQTWAIPRYIFQYGLSWEKERINNMIEKAILEAEEKGIKVVSLGLLNQAKELNRNGDLYLQKYRKLRLRIVDGSSLVVAIVLNSIPPKTNNIVLIGKLSKISRAIATELCFRGIQIVMTQKQEFYMLNSQLPKNVADHLKLSENPVSQVWIVGDGVDDSEQRRAPKGTKFIPFSQFPLKKMRRDCVYYSTPAMKVPDDLQNMHSCENWLPRRVMSASRIAGIVHALEGWNTNECGNNMEDYNKVWSCAIQHGFQPFVQEIN